MNPKIRPVSLIGALAILVASCASHRDSRHPEGADLILTGAKIFTSNERQPWAEAVAIKDGRFIYVGDSAGASDYSSESTHSVDLEGRFVIPGLIDAHAHPGYLGVEQFGEITKTDEEQMLAAVVRYAEEHPDQTWLQLCCWPIDLYVKGDRGPGKRKLDAIVPDRPVWFVSSWGHSAWLNSKALEVLGVDEDTPDPRSSVATYVRDADGKPTGWVKEGAGWQHLAEQFPIATAAHESIHEQGVLKMLRLLSQSGVTAVYDAGNFGYEDRVYGLIAKLEEEGRLPLRYEGTYQIFTPERAQRAVSEMKRYREEYGGERLQFNTVKLFMDGMNQNRSGALLQPHTDDPNYVGDTLLSVEELRDLLLELNEERFDLHVHTMGDLAVRRILDAVEEARNLVREDFYPRVTMTHLELIDSADLPRIVELGIICNFTPWWFTASRDDPLKISLGDDRYAKMYMAKTLVNSGVTVTFSSDEWWGGELLPTYLSPYFGMQVGHTRRPPREWWEDDEVGTRPPADEQLDIDQMIAGYTQNAAYQLRLEDQIGSIETGKLADLVLLDDSLFEIDRYEIWKIAPAAVMMEGAIIHGALPEGTQN